jgi:hypothetical protein
MQEVTGVMGSMAEVMRRVTEVRVPDDPAGSAEARRRTTGSGYVVALRAVLTARHVVSSALATRRHGSGMAAHPVWVRPLGDRGGDVPGPWLRAQVVWDSEARDVALVEVEGGTGVPGAAEWGEIKGSVGAEAIGFPVAERRADGVRDTVHVRGEVPFGGRWKSGMYDLDITSSVPRSPDQAIARSSWQGMSGAALLSHGRLIGVVVQDHLPAQYGGRSLAAVATTAIVQAEGFAEVAARLGIDTRLSSLGILSQECLESPPLPPGTVNRPMLRDQVVAALLAEGAPLVALVGPGGFGKTVLALQACHAPAVRQRYPGGVKRLTLGQAPDLVNLLGQAYTELTGGLPGPASEEDLSRKVRAELARRRAFLLIDDVWRQQLLTQLVVGTDGVSALVTTRNRGLVRNLASGATIIPVGDPLDGSEAIGMLAPPHDLDGAERAALGHLADRLGGWPLLLSLARSRLGGLLESQHLSLLDAVAQLEQYYDACGVTAFDPLELEKRQQAVAATLQSSLQDLPAPTRRQYTALAVFPPGAPIPLKLIAELWKMNAPAAWGLLHELADRSLLRFDGQTAQLHSTVRDFLYDSFPDPPALHRALLDCWGAPLRLLDPDQVTQLAWQLAKAGDDEGLYALISRDWLEHTLTVIKSPAGFLAYARAAADHAAHQTPPDQVQEVRCRLAIARAGRRFRGVLAETCRALARLGDVDRALVYASFGVGSYYGEEDKHVAAVVQGCAVHDPARAAQIARTVIQHTTARLTALADVAVAVAGTDDALSRSLAQEAVELLNPSANWSNEPTKQVVAAVAATDPGHAERLARTLPVHSPGGSRDEAGRLDPRTELWERQSLLRTVAEQAAGRDPDLAERLVRELPGQEWARPLALVSMAVAPSDPGRAERLAREAITAVEALRGSEVIKSEIIKQEALTLAIAALAPFDPVQAERRAREVRKRAARAGALASLAAVVARNDRPRGRILAEEAVQLANQVVQSRKGTAGYESAWSWELSRLVPTIATANPGLAEKTARSLPEEARARALSQLAEVLAETHRERALSLLEEVLSASPTVGDESPWVGPIFEVLQVLAAHDPVVAERAAAEFPVGWPRARALMALAVGLAQVDVRRAERTAASIPDAQLREMALTEVLKVIARTDLDEAVKIASRIRPRWRRNDALTRIAESVAQVDPSRAEGIVRSIKSPEDRKRALVRVATAMAERHPARAERIVEELESLYVAAPILAAAGQALAAADHARAKRFAARLLKAAQDTSPGEAVQLRTVAAITLARIDLAQAEAIIADLEDPDLTTALTAVATAAATVDPEGAERIAQHLAAGPYAPRSGALATVAKIVATYDVDRALNIARAVQPTGWGAHPLNLVLAEIASVDPARAHALAREIKDPGARAEAVAEVAAAAAAGGAPNEVAAPADTIQLLGQAEKPEPLLKGVGALTRSAINGGNHQLAVDLLAVLIETAKQW